MSYCCVVDGSKGMRDVTISLKWSELKYDIENGGYVEGELVDNEAEHVKHLIQDMFQEGNMDRVARILNLGYAECVEMMYGFTKEELEEDGYMSSNRLDTERDFIFDLSVPSTFSVTTADLLGKLLHEYLVCRAMEDWLSIVYPDVSVKWRDKLENTKRDIRRLLSHRMKRVRKKLRPF